MKAEFIDPFVSAAYNVFEAITGERPTRGQLSLRNSPFTTQQVTILAGVNGEIEGTGIYGMSTETAQGIAGAMMCAEIDALDEMAWSALAELGNMITGNATTLLSQKGYDVDITPPSVIRGSNVEISTRVASIVVPVNTKYGLVEISCALMEKTMSKAA